MFIVSKDRIIKSLDSLQKNSCAYFGPKGRGTGRCDCKYGYDGSNHSGEQTGCPELRSVVELLYKMTDKEYTRIHARKIKIRHDDGSEEQVPPACDTTTFIPMMDGVLRFKPSRPKKTKKSKKA